MPADRLAALAFALAALGLLMLASVIVAQLVVARRGARVLAKALEDRALAVAASAAADAATAAHSASLASQQGGAATRRLPAQTGAGSMARDTGGQADNVSAAKAPTLKRRETPLEHLAQLGARWLDTPLGRHAVAQEDRRLLDQCGFVDANARGLFLMSRLGSAAVLAVAAGWFTGLRGGPWFAAAAVALTAGFMLPKLALARRASLRRRSVIEELPGFVDLLRLLQGVGLSLDQSLQVMANDFRSMLPVLSREVEIAQRQFVAGRTREQSLQRLATSFGNEDLRAVVRLMIQVDRHGGAVQEPLKQFGDRLRETRRAMLRERIGRLTVKMTGVMILTLLPALLIVTAGPGVVTATHSLRTQRH
jgi:tight adherence protein C